MKLFEQKLAFFLLLWVLSIVTSAQAHLMPAQQGTLNIVDDGAFMVLSLPISAFDGIDDNNDGKVSMIAFNKQRATIVKSIKEHVILRDEEGERPLEDIILSPEELHHAPDEAISQLTVMGRFTLANLDQALHFYVDLYGKQTAEQMLKITATRQVDKQKHVFELAPKTPTATLFPNVEDQHKN